MQNDFISQMQDLRYLNWAKIKQSPGTPGCFLKAYDQALEKKLYYKISSYDAYRGVFGHECINELIVARLLDVLEIPHISYKLINALVSIDGNEIKTWLVSSYNFRLPNEEKMPLDTFYEIKRQNNKESPLEFCERYGWGNYVYQMFIVDFIIGNRDRHGANIEVLINRQTNTYRLAPLFDQGISLLFSTYQDESKISKVEPLKDIEANNFIGSRSLKYNLQLLPKGYRLPNKLLTEHRNYILNGLEVCLSPNHLNKIWQFVYTRFQYVEQLLHKNV